MGVFSFLYDYLREFKDIIVHPSQQMFYPPGTLFKGGPEWPCFELQIFARHCWGAIPRPVDSKPLPAQSDWPYFDPRLYCDPQFSAPGRSTLMRPLFDAGRYRSDQPVETADSGIWCGPITDHFGHMVADYGMRIAGSSRVDRMTPLVFSIWPLADAEPPPFFWQILDHLQVDRRRVMLIRKPTQFARLSVLPQAERRHGGGPSRRHLRMMDSITASPSPVDRDIFCAFVSRARLTKGRFAGESYLDEALAAAGVTVFHPETVDLHAQFRLYRQARRLIFSEGSALHALQLLGHLDSDIVVLTRRPRNRLAEASLRPRVRSLRYFRAARAVVPSLRPDGQPHPPAGISVFDEQHCLDAMASLGINLAPFWDPKAYAGRRDADIEAWMADRLVSATHPAERAMIEQRLRALSLRP